MPPGTRGISPDRPVQLDIQITYPNSHKADDERFMVELLGAGGSPTNNRTFSGSDGRAAFNVPPGSYRVKVSGQYIDDTTSDQFFVMSGEFMHHETISVKLKEGTGRPTSPAGTISAAELNVPDKARKEYGKGMDSLQSRDYKKAEEHFEKALKEYPQFGWAYNSLGVARMHLNNRQGAHEAFAKAVEIDPKNIHAQRNLARVLIAEEKWAEGESAARSSLTTQPQDPDGLTLLAVTELNQGKYDEALIDARRVHTGEKHAYPFAHLIAARACEAKQMNEQAAAEYRTYLQESPDAPDAKIAKEGLARLHK